LLIIVGDRVYQVENISLW